MKFSDLIQEIQEKATPKKKDNSAPIIITANQRQARFVRQQLANDRLIQLPEVTTLEQWIKNTWLNLQDLGTANTQKLLIDSKQEAFIWEELIQTERTGNSSTALPALIDAESIAKYVRDAYLTIHNYRIPLEKIQASHEAEAQYLYSQIPYFEKYLDTKGLCTHVQALQIIQNAYKNTLKRYSHAYLYGFIETYPSLEHLLEAIAEGYSHVDDTPSQEQVHQRHEFHDDNSELEMAAHWAKNQINQQPEQKIAIIVPNLTEVKTRIERIFLKIFDPNYYSDHREFETNRFFDISASDKLSSTPVIQAICSLLLLSQKTLKKNQVKQIACNPFWGRGIDNARLHLLEWVNFFSTPTIDTNLLARELAKIEARLGGEPTEENNAIVPIQQTDLFAADEHLVRQEPMTSALTPAQQLLEFRLELRKNQKQSNFAQWNEWLIKQLHILGWPGPRTLNSYEYQAVQSFFAVLCEMQTLDNVRSSGSVSLHKYTQQLNRILMQTPFHVQTTDAPIQILGLMEAAGLPFDASWITSMSEQQLPASPNPNPFIPLEIQIAYDTPRSSPAREFTYAQKLVNQLCHHNRNIIFSHSHNNENICHPSPFITHVPRISTDFKESNNAITRRYLDALKARSTVDETELFQPIDLGSAPFIAEGDTIHGGSYHLGLHAKNPLFAFLHYRVGAITPNEENMGINPMERGTLIHALMAHIYTTNTTQAKIKQWLTNSNYTDELIQLIRETIHQYLSSQQKHLPLLLEEVEIHILFERINTLLERECERPEFEIFAVEKAFDVVINKRHIRLRIDRIDSIHTHPPTANSHTVENAEAMQTCNKSLVIFDYKSGSTSLSGLQTQPIYDCQLPLYISALSSADAQQTNEPVLPIVATGYIELSAKNIAYLGICEHQVNELAGFVEPHQLTRKHLPSTWSETLHWWQDQLCNLVTEISLGQNHYQHRHPQQLVHYHYLTSAIRAEEIDFNPNT